MTDVQLGAKAICCDATSQQIVVMPDQEQDNIDRHDKDGEQLMRPEFATMQVNATRTTQWLCDKN